jgi:hypothetical protein
VAADASTDAVELSEPTEQVNHIQEKFRQVKQQLKVSTSFIKMRVFLGVKYSVQNCTFNYFPS